MPFSVYEAYNSRIVVRKRDSTSAKLIYFGFYSFDEAEVDAAFDAAIPPTHTVPDTGQVLLLTDYTPDHIGGGFWTAEATYESTTSATEAGQGGVSPPPPPSAAPGEFTPLGPDYSIDITNRTEKILQSKETVDEGGLGLIPETDRAIGITIDGEIQGVDRISPVMEFKINKQFSFVTLNYVRKLFSLVGKTNNATWYTFHAGEVLFMGATIQSKDVNKVSVTFQMAVAPNLLDVEISDFLTIPFKGGWEYVWVGYRTVESNGRMIQQPFYYKVERIYDEGNFNDLGIGS